MQHTLIVNYFIVWITPFYFIATGGGYEPDAHYSHWRRIHQSIEKRQTFHESLIKLLEG